MTWIWWWHEYVNMMMTWIWICMRWEGPLHIFCWWWNKLYNFNSFEIFLEINYYPSFVLSLFNFRICQISVFTCLLSSSLQLSSQIIFTVVYVYQMSFSIGIKSYTIDDSLSKKIQWGSGLSGILIDIRIYLTSNLFL